MKLRIGLVIAAALFGWLALGTSTAFADSPHFLSHSFSVSNSTGNLQCSFKEAGLGNTIQSAAITCTAGTSAATYQCFNNGGNHPRAGNKETVGGLVTNTQNFPVRNGQTTGTVTVGPNSPGTFSCPSGQSLYLVQTCYDDITLSGEGATTPTEYTGGNELCSAPLMIPVA
jgi:hypothetical protein